MSAEAASPETTIVVGIDGSEASKDALRWAARQAGLTGATVHAITVWHVPAPVDEALVPPSMEQEWEASSRKVLDQALREVLGENSSVRVRSSVLRGYPVTELLNASRDAELLVVGSRGHGAFTGMLLGSVSQSCASHASCPVVVVRHSPHPA